MWHYGMQEKGTSYEYRHIEAGFKQCQAEGLFDAMYWHPDNNESFPQGGYDAIFHVAFNGNYDLPEAEALKALANDIPVIQFDCDASFRFQDWILPRKHRVSHFVTTHNSTIPWYKSNGMNVIKSQWAGSPLYYKAETGYQPFDTSFLGQRHGIRGTIVSMLIQAGIKVHLFGEFWEGYPDSKCELLESDDMIKVFHLSKINLNFSNPSQGGLPQIKGRHVDILAAGGFQLCTSADNLEEYFVPNKEIVIVNSMPEMLTKIKYYLEHDDERNAIAEAGYQRVQKEHLWKHRLTAIFQEVGLS